MKRYAKNMNNIQFTKNFTGRDAKGVLSIWIKTNKIYITPANLDTRW